MLRQRNTLRLSALGSLLLAITANAQNLTVAEDFTGAFASQNWTVFDGACLTAGDGTGAIPACSGLPYYGTQTQNGGVNGTMPDAVGSGALRFTNNATQQTGAILSNFSFPSGSGIAITFSTVTYAGNGADGIGFFLIDGSVSPTSVGGSGGSLGYSCSNTNGKYDGLAGAYIGLGMDEFGNFLNASDNTSTGDGFVADRIGLRGAGNISWASLIAAKPGYYSSMAGTAANRMAAVKKTCSTGYYWDYSRSRTNPTSTAATATALNDKIPYAYNLIQGSQKTLPSGTSIDSRATRRPAAAPISYQLKITRDNLLSLSYSYNGGTYQQVMRDQSIADANGPIPNTLKFGFSGSTGGSTNIHEVMCFKAAPATRSSSSAGTNAQQGSEIRTGTQVYLAGYNTNNWSGQLTSQNLVVSPTSNAVSIAANANWDGSCVLTGGICTTMGGTSISAQGPTARTMLTWGATSSTTNGGIPFQYNSLSTAQKSQINTGDAVLNANRLNYLRGDRSTEGSTTTNFRTRDSVLGDIIDSGPALVGIPTANYGAVWTDNTRSTATHPENAAAAQKYSAFATANKTRMNVVYTGANDGFLHGFRSGAYNAAGDYTTTTYPNDGREVLAYMPSTVFNTIQTNNPNQDYANRLYSHAYDVNAVPYAGELFYANAWHTWLVGGLGAGGAGIYALDVTDPTQFSEANAASIVKADWSTSNLPCYIGTSASQACGAYLGNTYGQPQIRRFHNGSWGYVFGNGRDSTNGKAGIFVVLVSPTDGSQTVYFLNTNSGTTTAKNGITYVTPADLDGDRITDFVYAGDVNGNIWRFDLTAALPSAWFTSTFGTTVPTPLFSAGLPITTKPVVSIVPAASGNARVMVSVGTGYKSAQTATSAATFTAGSHRFYGIWDWDMGTYPAGSTTWTANSWNSKTVSTGWRAGLSGTKTIAVSDLQQQTIIALPSGQRALTSLAVCWQGGTECTSANNKYGWYITLPTTTEQAIYNPILYNGMLMLTSTIPAAANVLNCNDDSTDTGYLMAVAPATGGSFRQSTFADANGNFSLVTVSSGSATNTYAVSAVSSNAVGSPSMQVVAARGDIKGGTVAVLGRADGSGLVLKVNENGANIGSRVTWQQIR